MILLSVVTLLVLGHSAGSEQHGNTWKRQIENSGSDLAV
jgi:hypothetical protein